MGCKSISVEWEKKIDTVNDTQFKEANEMFHAMLVKLKQAGKGSVYLHTKSKTQFLRKTFWK